MQKLNKTSFFLVGLILAILPYLYLSFFVNPSADDFSLSGQAQQNEFFHLMYHNYFFWNGRYISNIFIYLNPIAFGSFVGYKTISFLMMVLLIFVNSIFIAQIFVSINNKKRLIASLVLSLLFIQNMPIISEGIYWFTGSIIYLLGVFVFMSYLTLLIFVLKKKGKIHHDFLLIILLFLACGFNEVLTLLIVLFLTTMVYVFYRNKTEEKKQIMIQCLFACLFAGVMIFSPGNEFRENAYENAHNLSYSLIFSSLQVARFSLTWITSIPLVAASFIYFQFNKELKENNVLIKKSFYINRWLSLLSLLAVIFICVFPPYWATGILGQHRTLNVAYFFFLILWFINLTVWYNYYQNKFNFSLTKRIQTTLAVFLLVGFMFTGNGYHSLSDIFSGAAINYNKQMNNRYTKLEEFRKANEKKVVLKEIKNPPKCLFVSDITENEKDWTNQAYNLYFRLDSLEIVLK